MFVSWQHRVRLYEGLFGHSGVRWKASLIENVRVDGKSNQRHVTLLGSFLDRPDFGARSRVWFWDNVNVRLNRLGNRVSPQDRKKIEDAIARKVKRPTPEEIEDHRKRPGRYPHGTPLIP
jgi:hypothetical protein